MVDDDDEYEEEESKGEASSEGELEESDCSIESEQPAKKKKKPAQSRKSEASSNTANKRSINSSAGPSDIKKRNSEISNAACAEEPTYIDQEDEVIGGGFTSLDEVKDARPNFIKEEFIMDDKKRRPENPDFDPTTLYI